MAVIVQHKQTGQKYFLVGSGFGMYKSARPNRLLGDIMPKSEEGSAALLAVCDAAGEIHWVDSSEFRVYEIDGIRMSPLRQAEAARPDRNPGETDGPLVCPACGTKLDEAASQCPECGITLLTEETTEKKDE